MSSKSRVRMASEINARFSINDQVTVKIDGIRDEIYTFTDATAYAVYLQTQAGGQASVDTAVFHRAMLAGDVTKVSQVDWDAVAANPDTLAALDAVFPTAAVQFNVVESGNTITACKMLGIVPVSHEPEDFNLYVRTVGATVRVTRSDTDETLVSAVGFHAAMVALANYYGLPVTVEADPGVKITAKIREINGTYEPTKVHETVGLNDGTRVRVGDLVTVPEMGEDAPIFEITAITPLYTIMRDVKSGLRVKIEGACYWHGRVIRPLSEVATLPQVGDVIEYLSVDDTWVRQTVVRVNGPKVIAESKSGDLARILATDPSDPDGCTVVADVSEHLWLISYAKGWVRTVAAEQAPQPGTIDADELMLNPAIAQVVARVDYFGKVLTINPAGFLRVSDRDFTQALRAGLIVEHDEWITAASRAVELLIDADRVEAFMTFNPDFMAQRRAQVQAETDAAYETAWVGTGTTIRQPIRTGLAKRARKSAKRAKRHAFAGRA